MVALRGTLEESVAWAAERFVTVELVAGGLLGDALAGRTLEPGGDRGEAITAERL